MSDEQCPDQGFWGATVGIGLIVGTIASSIPQIVRLAKRKNTVGLSGNMLHLANYNQFMVVANAYILDFDRIRNMFSSFWCFAWLFSWFQLIGLWSCYYITWTLFGIYFKNDPTYTPAKYRANWICWIVFTSFAVLNFIIFGITVSKYGTDNSVNKGFATAWGIISTIISLGEWIPQIVKTARLRHPGSLSIIMLGIQTPGCFIIFLYMLLVTGESWSTWLGYLITVIQEIILLSILLAYYCNGTLAEDPALKQEKLQEGTGLLEGSSDDNQDAPGEIQQDLEE
ncbi:hypothetical protein ADUPG1_010633 [Aduncisulcus paluster]|uniref:Uncharacterized protein n=1 Tax=Aduncisulcus paluster TaxID=2918883 RepID=A0ABQ5JS69_9EUKA|nr:hypothetical protein ADUPG1_010633 [Aduncisulcus paluster]